MRKFWIGSALLIISMFTLTGMDCTPSEKKGGGAADRSRTVAIGDKLALSQPTPTDINYSIERYNLIRRTYWVNGLRGRARSLPKPIADMPLGYVVLLTNSGAVVGKFTVDGKVTSLQSHLTPDSDFFEIATGATATHYNRWLADVDGAYGSNGEGIFFFTPDGRYLEWSGPYLYSDIPFEVSNPVLRLEAKG